MCDTCKWRDGCSFIEVNEFCYGDHYESDHAESTNIDQGLRHRYVPTDHTE